MSQIAPHKKLGQHFLKDKHVAQEIVQKGLRNLSSTCIVEIGPGTGALTQWWIAKTSLPSYLIEIDSRCVAYLKAHYLDPHVQIIENDFLKWDWHEVKDRQVCLLGNLPYNISSPILFQLLAHRAQVSMATFMLQEEVARRIVAPPGSKTYGLLSVYLQAFYEQEYLFSVPPTAFDPPPKVNSGVIQLRRRASCHLPCDEKLFFQLVKTAFQQRRKMLRNSLKNLHLPLSYLPSSLLTARPETLCVHDFVQLTQLLSSPS